MPLPEWARRAQGLWRWTGSERPPFARPTGPGQESVWDYPRPPRIEPDTRTVVVKAGPVLVAETTSALRMLETASPPTFYIPPGDVVSGVLLPAPGSSRCEWKGTASYWGLRGAGPSAEPVAWSYADPFDDFADLRDHVAFYPGRVECTVDGEAVRTQVGGFYGGWITDDVVGPFKGDPGSGSW